MGNGQRRTGLLAAALLVGSLTLGAPAARAAPAAPTAPPPSSPSLPAGPWPPSEVLAADPGTVAAPEVPLPEVTAQVAVSCPTVGYGVNHYAPGRGRTVALTFDDGPGSSTAEILRILQDAGVTATFFNVGVNQAVRPALVQAEAAHGFLLGNHSWSHPDMATQSSAAQAAEMDRATAQQNSLVGSPPCFFRPPYGSFDSTTLSLAQARNMHVWNWSVDTEDWKAAGSASSYWVDRIITRAKAGGDQSHPVVLMHNQPAGNPATVAALPSIITFYRDRGYTFVDLAGRVAGRLPFGALDSVGVDGRRLSVHGWAIDPDALRQPVPVHVYVDGVGQAVLANESRPDVGAVYPAAGGLHGYTAAARVGPGAHTVCVYAIDTSVPSSHTALGCRTVTARMP
jgi:peptidoglycan/xylan/chitin deacetylase (PgdA/CDA1 family)